MIIEPNHAFFRLENVMYQGIYQAFWWVSFMNIIYGLQNLEKNYWQMH